MMTFTLRLTPDEEAMALKACGGNKHLKFQILAVRQSKAIENMLRNMRLNSTVDSDQGGFVGAPMDRTTIDVRPCTEIVQV